MLEAGARTDFVNSVGRTATQMAAFVGKLTVWPNKYKQTWWPQSLVSWGGVGLWCLALLSTIFQLYCSAWNEGQPWLARKKIFRPVKNWVTGPNGIMVAQTFCDIFFMKKDIRYQYINSFQINCFLSITLKFILTLVSRGLGGGSSR